MAADRSMSTERFGTAAIQGDGPGGRFRATAARLRMAALVFSADRRELLELSVLRFWRASIVACCLFCLVFIAVLILWPFRIGEVGDSLLRPQHYVYT